ncbi:t-SNARE [Pilobolus umbonatus]|nr:t-SNARE [Pilobolus umbonatus]
MADEDPFLIVKSQVEDSLVDATTLFESWKRIQQTVSSPQNQELLWTADELHSSLENIEQDLEDLEEAFSISQKDPSQFNLSKQDIKNRRQFLNQSHNKLKNQQLDGITGTIFNLKEIASTMNREVDDHVVILDELGYQVDRSEGRLKGAMRRVTDILKREEAYIFISSQTPLHY